MMLESVIPEISLQRKIGSIDRYKLLGAMLLVVIIGTALFVGYRVTVERAFAQQSAVAQEIEDSIAGIVEDARRGERKLANLLVRPCDEIKTQLALEDVFVPYRRSAMMVKDGEVYCSTVLGSLSISLASYLTPTKDSQLIVFLPGTKLIPNVPVMAIYTPVAPGRGILYLVEGAYIKDVLARAKASGENGASVSDGTNGTLTSDGRFVRTDVRAPGMNEISVKVQGNINRVRTQLITTEIVALFIGLSVDAALLFGYVAGFTPRQRLERQVRQGLRRNEFYVEYQAIVDLKIGQWVGAEALLRWLHPRLGLIMPGRFIGEIETTPVIAPLTEFVLDTALAELEACAFPDGFRVSVNLAPKHIEMRCFPDDLGSTLRRRSTHFQVVLEITERGLLTRLADSHKNLMSLKEYGVQYAVDDFGTDNSNLALLQRFPFDCIKIDKQFTEDAAIHGRQLVEGIAYLANKLGLIVIAEGVEEVAQRNALKEVGIRFAQGFLFQRPANILEFERMYRAARAQMQSRAEA